MLIHGDLWQSAKLIRVRRAFLAHPKGSIDVMDFEPLDESQKSASSFLHANRSPRGAALEAAT